MHVGASMYICCFLMPIQNETKSIRIVLFGDMFQKSCTSPPKSSATYLTIGAELSDSQNIIFQLKLLYGKPKECHTHKITQSIISCKKP